MRTAARIVVVVAAAAAVLAVAPSASAVDPGVEWHTIRTPHFTINFYDGEEAVAQHAAGIVEKIHEIATGFLGWTPSEITQIVVYDDVDTANGSAGVRPYNTINIFASPPGSTSSLNDYDEWLWGLILHEYVHIVHLDMAYGIPRVLNRVFGKMVTPNQVQPRWFIEGLATYAESRWSGGGRIRSSLFNMYLRTAILEDAFPGLDVVSSGGVRWPQGTIAYLYGSHFLDFIARHYGEEKLAEISREYAARIIPYSLNKIAKKVAGEDYLTLYDQWKVELGRVADEAVLKAKRRPLTAFDRLTRTAQNTNNPQWTPSGGLVWYAGTRDDYPRLLAQETPGGPVREVVRVNGGGNYAIAPGGATLVMSQSEVFREFYSFTDLYRVEAATGEVTRLTEGLRADEPDVSPDGTRIAFVRTAWGLTRLCLMPVHPKAAPLAMPSSGPGIDLPAGVTCLWSPTDATVISSPRWSPDGKVIAVSAWTPGGERDIYLVDAKTGVPERLTADRAIDTEPSFTADGRHVLYSSDRTGIPNIFAFDRETRAILQVSNVLTGAFGPRASPDGTRIAFTVYGHDGFDVAVMPLDLASWRDADPYLGGRPIPPIPGPGSDQPIRPYAALDTLLPRAWFPIWEADSFGAVYGVIMHGSDVVGKHSYNLALKYGVDGGGFLYEAGYTNRSFYPRIDLYSGRSNYNLGYAQYRDGHDIGYLEYNTRGTAALTFPFTSWEVDQSIAVDYSYEHLEGAPGARARNFQPSEEPPRLPPQGDLASVSLSYLISTARGYLMSVSAEEGAAFNASFSYYGRALGGAFDIAKVEARGRAYHKVPLLPHHVAAFNLSYGTGSGDQMIRRLFYLGGVPDRDIVKDLMDDMRVGGENLRGYPPYSIPGDSYTLGNFEYRFPLFIIERGLQLLPFYLRRAHGALFVDVGNAWVGPFRAEELRVGSGIELRIDMLMGYYVPATLRTGYAEGFSSGGMKQFYYVLGVLF